MKKILCFGLMLVLLLTLPMGCKKKAAELKIVELHEVTRSVFYAPQYVALNLGYFEAEGLNVNITTSGGSDKAMTALLSGDADICLAGPETAVYVYNAGQEQHPVVVGQLTKRDGSFLMSRVDEPGFAWESLGKLWWLVALGGLAQTGIYFFYYRNLKRHEVWVVKLALLLMPVLSCFIGVFFLGEELTGRKLLGILIVLAGAAVLLLRGKLHPEKNAE